MKPELLTNTPHIVQKWLGHNGHAASTRGHREILHFIQFWPSRIVFLLYFTVKIK